MVRHLLILVFVVLCSVGTVVFGSQVYQGVIGSGAPLGSTLSSGAFFVGNSSNVATEYSTSGLNLNFSVPGDELLTVGKASVGGLPAFPLNIATFGHKDTYASFGFAFAQDAIGNTLLNAALGSSVSILNSFNTLDPMLLLQVGALTTGKNYEFRMNGLTSGYTGWKSPSAPTSYVLTMPTATSGTDDLMKFTTGTASFGKLVNANVDASAAIAVSKLATVTANRNLESDGSGFISADQSYGGGLVPFGQSDGSLGGADDNLKYIDTTGLAINHAGSFSAAIYADILDTTHFGLHLKQTGSFASDIIRLDDSSASQIWGVDSRGQTKVNRGSVGTASGSVYGLNDTNTGINWGGADDLVLFTSGTSSFTCDNTTGCVANKLQLGAQAGTAGAPGFTFAGDTDTGIASTANTLLFSTGGSTRVTVNSTGLGLATSPTQKFHLAHNSAELLVTGNGNVSTTDATPTTVHTFTTASNRSYHYEVRCTARRTGGSAGTAGDTASYRLIGTFKNVSGTLTQVGTTTAIHTAEDQAGWDCTLGTSGTAIVVTGTGAANNNINWEAIVDWVLN